MWLLALGFWISSQRLDKPKSVLPANRAQGPSGYLVCCPKSIFSDWKTVLCSITSEICSAQVSYRKRTVTTNVLREKGLGNLAVQKKSNTLGYKKLAVEQQEKKIATADVSWHCLAGFRSETKACKCHVALPLRATFTKKVSKQPTHNSKVQNGYILANTVSS